jgi:protein transport protein SEC61 subunit alpha
VAEPDSVPLQRWRCYVANAAFLVGLCIGALTLLAGLVSVVGSGTGIMLAVTIVYSCLEGTRGRPAGAFGF